jgi:selenocysteine lyase/cysteine desulfurase
MGAKTLDRAIGLDHAWVRAQFPALKLEVNGQPAAFLDGPGGTQVPQRVVDAMVDYLVNSNANTVGAFLTSERNDAMLAEAHRAMADLLGCEPDEVFFGQNTTTNILSLSRSLGRELSPGDEIVVTRLDHDANVTPWRFLEEKGVVIRHADINARDCTLDLGDLAAKITPRTRLVAAGYAANVTGTINPVAEIVRLAHQAGALTFIDAVHYAPHGAIDVRALIAIFFPALPTSFSGRTAACSTASENTWRGCGRTKCARNTSACPIAGKLARCRTRTLPARPAASSTWLNWDGEQTLPQVHGAMRCRQLLPLSTTTSSR